VVRQAGYDEAGKAGHALRLIGAGAAVN
jgi:hypothetical protein